MRAAQADRQGGLNNTMPYTVADTSNRNYCISPEEDKANALLIAAAPELLKLLCRFVANDHVLDELTSEAQALIDRLGGG